MVRDPLVHSRHGRLGRQRGAAPDRIRRGTMATRWLTSGRPGIPSTRVDVARVEASPTNVLVTAAGRRTSLVRAFVDAAHERGARAFAGDVDGLAPALLLADEAVRTRRSDDPGYIPDLATIVERHAIRVVVPTIDPDLAILAAGRADLEKAGCTVVLSSAAFLAITIDKQTTAETFGSAGIDVPRSWSLSSPTADLPAEVFVKPRQGSASKDVHRIERTDLANTLALVPDAMIQEVLTGPEITIDALLDLEGRPIHFVPRRRIKTIGGESVQGVTLDHDDAFATWIERVLAVSSELGAAGPLTIQAFLTARGPVLSEVNPRFGGGFPLALAAGADYPAWLLDMVAGRTVAPRLRAYTPGLYMTRYHVEQFVERPMW